MLENLVRAIDGFMCSSGPAAIRQEVRERPLYKRIPSPGGPQASSSHIEYEQDNFEERGTNIAVQPHHIKQCVFFLFQWRPDKVY